MINEKADSKTTLILASSLELLQRNLVQDSLRKLSIAIEFSKTKKVLTSETRWCETTTLSNKNLACDEANIANDSHTQPNGRTNIARNPRNPLTKVSLHF